MRPQKLVRELHVRRKDLAFPLVESIMTSIDSALSQRMLESLRNDPLSFVNSSINPKDYEDAESFRRDYLCVETFSKFKHLDTGIDKQKVALEKFSASEDQCRDANRRLSSARNYDWQTTSVFATASRKIDALLGPFNWDEAEQYFDFGPGGTTRLPKRRADRYYKFSGIPECTPNCESLARTALRFYARWGDVNGRSVKIVPGNAVITVQKNAKTDRVIAKEPCMNIFIQKGIGGIIRRRLKRVGINLNDQTTNQKLAYAGSVDDSLATIDLSAASDTVSLEIVRCLLPPDWVDAIMMCRSEQGVLPDGTSIRYQKVSSMGNGFTFELESLIFWALCSSVLSLSTESDRRLSVYGDDIIVPKSIVPDVVKILEFAGFTVNLKKTHLDGPFRESCGKHYFKGVDVTPIYVKDRVDNYPRYIWICNQIKRWSWNRVYGCDPLIKPAYDLVRSHLAGYWAEPHIPDGLGDGALIGDFDEVLPVRAPDFLCGYMAKFYAEMRKGFDPTDEPMLLKALWRLECRKDLSSVDPWDSDDESSLSVPTRERRYLLSQRAVWQWQDLGPWLV